MIGGRGLEPARFIPLGCALEEIRIEVEPGEAPAPTAEVLERWERATRANKRLFNGPILRCVSFDAATRTIRASRDTYQRYSMQSFDGATSTFGRDIYHLAVTGVLLARDGDGRECVLLGKRGRETLLYPDMWELAPGGGLDSTDVYAQLLQEMEEELGMAGLVDGSRRDEILEPPGAGDVLGLAIDPNTPSADIVVRVRIRPGAGAIGADSGARSWEYGMVRWAPLEELPAISAREVGRIIPPTLAIWRGLGWLQ